MKVLAAEKVYYEIETSLGFGLTSEVYKALRKDAKGMTTQEVALKIIKSKKDVQILRQEFENLLRVNSKYCVQVLAWESLKNGPALVLEYIHGVTLHELVAGGKLCREMVLEIGAQVCLGLRALHRSGIYHGDLNLQNIMISEKGIVKLIDFGFGDESGEQCLTPKFASQQRLRGEAPSVDSDFYALAKIIEHLLGTSDNEWVYTETTKGSRRRRLSEKVKILNSRQAFKTRRSSLKPTYATKSAKSRWALALVTFLVVLSLPLWWRKPVEYQTLNIRSHHWFKYSLNDLPHEFGPIVGKSLRKGRYRINVKDHQSDFQQILDLDQSQTFLLQPGANKL